MICVRLDKDMVIDDIRLIKTGGKSGDYMRKEGKVLSINISDKKGVIKAYRIWPIYRRLWIENDAHSGNWHRQVSLLAIESFVKWRIMN